MEGPGRACEVELSCSVEEMVHTMRRDKGGDENSENGQPIVVALQHYNAGQLMLPSCPLQNMVA